MEIHGEISKEQIKHLILEHKLELTDLIDVVIDVNGFVGVGLITLSDGVSEYIRNKITMP